jgi:hypothetical protein
MNMHRRQRLAGGIAVMGIGVVVALGSASATHAQSSAPLLSVYRTASGSAEQVAISGSGFTPGGSVSIEILDRTSGVVLATTSLQATTSTVQVGSSVAAPLACTPVQVASSGAGFPQGDSMTKVAGGSWGSQPSPCVGGLPCKPLPPGAGALPGVPQCQTAVVPVPQPGCAGDGGITTSVQVASTDSLLVEAIDTATGAATSQVAL